MPKVAFKQAAKPAVAPVAKQAATPAAATPGKKFGRVAKREGADAEGLARQPAPVSSPALVSSRARFGGRSLPARLPTGTSVIGP